MSTHFSCVQTSIGRWRRGVEGTPYLTTYDRELVLKPATWLRKSWGGYRRTTLHHIFLGFLNFGSFKTSPRNLT